MICLDVVQGTPEWLAARLGIPTASQFHRILTPKTLKPSASADGYVAELVAEWMLNRPLQEESGDFMARGRELEESAVAFYELERDVETETVGFILRDDRRVGCSPDRLVGGDGGLEVKCPSAAVHVGYLLGYDMDKYRCQVQGALWLTGRAWWDWLSYHPELPPALVRIERDEEFIGALEVAVAAFLKRLDAAQKRIIGMGWAPSVADNLEAFSIPELVA